MIKKLALVLAFVPFGTVVSGQTVDCTAPETQHDMNYCADQFYRMADEDLNLAYKQARSAARQIDEYRPTDQPSAERMLKEAQRAWIAFRDQACATESMLAAGGSMQPTLHFSCLERLTRNRTEDLRYFGEVN
jgi:uncharacterized protein YecT (DUF1311 family)